MTYGYCVYHEIECDYKGSCINCPHNTEEDTEWFKQDEQANNTEIVDHAPTIIETDIPTMYYPQVEGITPTVINNGIELPESEEKE